ncbi:MAG: phosphate ABC transporter substrate-binding protein [Chloroflexi bacterium]|nr:phosphate ABC transporter substrate-binding protein [Chloroflexota bacterium]
MYRQLRTTHHVSRITFHASRFTHHASRFTHHVFRFSFFAFLLFLAACVNPLAPTPPPATLRIAGSTSMMPVLRELAAAYQARHPHVLVDVQGGGSASGESLLKIGAADLAAVSWQEDAQHQPEGVTAIPIARDAVAVVVHPKNNVKKLTLLQVRAIYRGEVLDWAALGGPAEEPMIVSREDGSGTRAAFEALVMGGDRVTLNALVMPTSAAVVDYVAHHRAAIGYVTIAALTDTVRAVPMEELLPSPANLRSGAYHLSRALYLYAPDPAPSATQAFVDFVLSPAGQTIVAKYHVPLR